MPDADEARAALALAVVKARRQIQRINERNDRVNETQTRTSLIGPVLVALGWDTADLDDVRTEYPSGRRDDPVDYALLIDGAPVLFVEAKALGTNLEDRKCKVQTVNYANTHGVAWCVLTDGDRYCIYNACAQVDVDDKILRSVSISDDAHHEQTLDTLMLLGKDNLRAQTIGEFWQADIVNRQVRSALEALFGGVDEGLVRLVRKQLPRLLPGQIRETLRRADVAIRFPEPVPNGAPAVPATRTALPRPARHVRLTDLLRSGLVKVGDRWRMDAGGGLAFGEISRDGQIVVDGKRYPTPSHAAAAAKGLSSWNQAANGWGEWHYQDASGSWRPADDLRERLRNGETDVPPPQPVAAAHSPVPDGGPSLEQASAQTAQPQAMARTERRRRVTIADLLHAGVVAAGDRWCGTASGREVSAEVTADGRLSIGDETFATPSAAASHATGWQAVDGWRWWKHQDAEGDWRPIDGLRRGLEGMGPRSGGASEVAATPRTIGPPEPMAAPMPPDVAERLTGNPRAQALFGALLPKVHEAVGRFAVHANSKHIVLSNRSAFVVIRVIKGGLRLGLRLDASEVGEHPRLRAQPRGTFEGWSACHVSTTIADAGDLDEELLALIARAYETAS